MKKLALVIRAHKGSPRMNASLTNQSRGSKWWSAIQGNIPENPVNTDKHYRNIGQGEVLKYLRRKMLSPH